MLCYTIRAPATICTVDKSTVWRHEMTNPQLPITTRDNLKEKFGFWQLKSTNRHSTVQPSCNTFTSASQLLRCSKSARVTVTVTVHPQHTQCPSVNRVTASDLPLNDSEGCPSSLLTLLTLLGFIINDSLSAGYSNMQDLQTSVWMNKLLSQCLDHHLPLSWKRRHLQPILSRWHLMLPEWTTPNSTGSPSSFLMYFTSHRQQ